MARNPYGFVPFEHTAPRTPVPWRSQASSIPDLHSGLLHCTLSVLTPLFIWSGPVDNRRTSPAPYEPYWHHNHPILPASSLKGMLRSVIETVSDSCMIAVADALPIPPGYTPCPSLDALCPACALLGMVESTPRAGEQQQVALAGRVRIGNAESKQPVQLQKIILPARKQGNGDIIPIGNPNVKHKPFYLGENRLVLGRKFYYRTRVWEATLEEYRNRFPDATIQLPAISPDTQLSFQVLFHNLSDAELALLLYGLTLESDMCHHLGYGKPYGLGSVRIAVDQIVLDASPPAATKGLQRYLTYAPTATATTVKTMADFANLPATVWNRPTATNAHDALRDLLQWPRDERFLYPKKGWFEGAGNGVTLAAHQVQAGSDIVQSLPHQINANRWRARVKWFNEQSGSGFILGPTEKDVYVSAAEIQGYQRLFENEIVEFTLEQGPKGPIATNVVPIKKEA